MQVGKAIFEYIGSSSASKVTCSCHLEDYAYGRGAAVLHTGIRQDDPCLVNLSRNLIREIE